MTKYLYELPDDSVADGDELYALRGETDDLALKADTTAAPGTLAARDANGRAKFADPVDPQDAVTQAYGDGIYEKALSLIHDVTHADYGGVADGTTDNTTASQSAADTVASEGGGIVFYPATTSSYWHSGTLSLTSTHKNVAFIGAGRHASEITCAGQFIDGAQDADQTTITDLHIRCTTDPNTVNGIYANTPRRWSIKRCFFQGFGGDTIQFEAGLHCEIEYNLFHARDPSGTNGHAALHIKRRADDTTNTTTTTYKNYVITGVEYGFLVVSAKTCGFYNDIAEGVNVGFRFHGVSGIAVFPYTENIGTTGIERHDSPQMHLFEPRGTVQTTWTNVAAADRYPLLLSRDSTDLGKQANTLGLSVSGDLAHSGSSVGFFGAAAVAQQTAPASLTDNSGGTTDDTVAAVSGSGDDATINNNFAELAEEQEKIRQALVNLGLWA